MFIKKKKDESKDLPGGSCLFDSGAKYQRSAAPS